ncbi:NAD-dependent epimerase/dehydratase family protein [Marinobacter salarius]|jgi:nucleoside-diphosphate-sugar epimerase|uniref:D-erythronate dehydrogenase n=1 Tax=Marinobacter salarius TaxID=1420917 RepID=UPI001BCE1F50|nr:D-erythronate dehydrogenase [Marinobacter salarius]MBS8231309.1 NAD-dependent epimerase/dehydratase family protein [Marinobacter salarius]|tara:strand:+ start:5257 stop:6219 length:963 start_codon:yes stop_codon:yes gene_type:complete
MHIVITGAAGFLGQRLVDRLVSARELAGQTLSRLTLIDQVEPNRPVSGGITVHSQALDISQPGALDEVLAERPDVIYHLAAIVSSAAEEDLDLGMRVNFDVTRALVEGCRRHGLSGTRLVMASSVAAYGGNLPEILDDMTALHPQNSYGAQKAMSELLINDYSRRGLVDGLVLRLPTIVIRPGRPNAAASSFASSILREPLNGEDAVCPVDTSLNLFVMSPATVVDALVHGANVSGDVLGPFRAFMLPGITVSVAEMIETLREVGGESALAHVRYEPDGKIEAIVGSWPSSFTNLRANKLGFRSERDFRDIVKAFLDERA